MASPPTRLRTSAEQSDTDDMDDISVTSTDYGVNHEDQDKEWTVEALYAERDHPEIPGEKQYLISWEGFPMDQCTWEPVENLGPGLLTQWAEIQEEIAAGQREPFNVEIYNTAVREKDSRHERRNAKRKRLGLPLTLPLPVESPTESLTPTTQGDEMVLDDIPKESSNNDTSRQTPKANPQKIIKQKTFHGIPSKPAAAEVASGKNLNKTKRAPTHPIPSKPAQQPPKPRRAVSSDGKTGTTITGYQGTARKPIKDGGKASGQTSLGQTTSSSVSKPASSLPPKMTSSLANKFAGKRHTATRTRPQPQPTTQPIRKSNVFVGGKERKKRASLGDVMDDPSKTPRAFNSMRVINIAKKRGIERTDGAHLDIASIPPSFFLTNDQRSRQNPGQANPNSPTTTIANAPIVQSPTAISPKDMSATTPALKPKKSVRFTGAEDNTSEDTPMGDAMGDATDEGANPIVQSPMDIDHPLEAPQPDKAPPSRKLSLATYQEREQTQMVLRTTIFGKAGSEPIQVLFCGITRQTQPWLLAFMAQKTLHFDSICASYNFLTQSKDLSEEILSTGTIEAKSTEVSSSLRNVAEGLKRGSYGSHLVTKEFSILVYPSKCSHWDGLGINIGKSESDALLRFIIYKPSCDVKLYPPAVIPRAPTSLTHMEQESHDRILIKELSGLDFSLFLPQNPKEKDNQVFMLLFPKREEQVCNIVKLWLRSCQPSCQIFAQNTHGNPDSWAQFHKTVQAGAAGTIILHEDVSIAIRKLPRIFQLIDNKCCYTFWDLATGQYNPPRFPSSMYAPIEPGTLQMTRLFPQGRAFLITPSFALSDPVQLLNFLKWFKNYCCNPHYLIMACADFPNYLKKVTLEKEAERKRMCSEKRQHPHLEELLTESGLGKQQLEARFQAWEVLREIMRDFGDEQTGEDIRKVEWVTNFIDPNDEQSLVNYFCWWSVLKCDRFRKFTVLGSSDNKNRAAYRNIEIPVYTEETVSDPDAALALEDVSVATDDTSMVPTPHTPTPRPLPGTDSAAGLHRWLLDVFNRSCVSRGNWARLHSKPVSWLNVAMADHFGDPRCEYDTFNNWLGGTLRFSKVNTWYGLFYTIDQAWDPQTPSSSYKRHPWVGVLRPINPHFAPVRYAGVELFIWDMFARDRERSRGKGALLLDMQRRLIDLVKRDISQKDPNYFLGRVFVSSTTDLRYKPDDAPLAVTKRRIEEMITDGQVWLPPFGNLLPNRGWVRIPEDEWQIAVAPSKAQEPKPFPKNHSDKYKVERSIWHAPRPRVKPEKSACINQLYEAARSARVEDPSCQMMKYQYRSTLDWYHDMKVEGRDSSHVQVDSADKILAKLFQKK
ncbi:hypothetical protein Daesc_002642 [Daldinia eschscholtzii]|uniref:Chromo domain-containing protein n=1 Tax=Daldinia eschscholtzii TaxID=292717 RepID=A0AAX6MS62_9PEZI